MSAPARIRIAVVIPTYNRLSRLQRCLESLTQQTLPASSFEVVVVVDGSTDGTAAWLETWRPPHRFRFIVQENRGLSAARNRGNAETTAGLVLCLDDDMIASPDLVAEHLRAHEGQGQGRLWVQGGLKLHDALPRTPFLRYEEELRDRFAHEKSAAGATLDSEDVSGGNFSLPKALLEAAGGFNEALKGLRNTDGELAYRLSRQGVAIVYRHRALAFMTHSNDFEASLQASVLYGKSYVFTHRQHPETIWRLSPLVHDRGSQVRNALRRIYLRPRREWGFAGFERRLRAGVDLAERLGVTVVARALYRVALDFHFWKGVHAGSGGRLEDYLPRGVPILCYHQVSDEKRFRFRHYILPVATFAGQMRWLKEHGYTAVSLDAVADYLERGVPLPPKPVVITFDDGYQELKRTATPVLAALGFRHTHFLTTGKLGGTTDWVETAPDLPLLSPDDVREMAAAHGEVVDLQAHGQNHLAMSAVDREQARGEVLQSIATIAALTGRTARYLAYPYGEYDERTPAWMRELPVRASFTVDRGLARPGQDLHLLARVEVFSNDFSFDFRSKVRRGWSPLANLRIAVGRLIETLSGALSAPAAASR